MEFKKSGPLKGEITVPGDKSISHRAVMFGSLAKVCPVSSRYRASSSFWLRYSSFCPLEHATIATVFIVFSSGSSAVPGIQISYAPANVRARHNDFPFSCSAVLVREIKDFPD